MRGNVPVNILLLVLLSQCCTELCWAFAPLFQAGHRHSSTTGGRARPSLTTIHAKKKKGSAGSPVSPFSLESLTKMVMPGAKPSSVESGIEAALILTDKKRQEEWKKDMRQQFPLVPSFVVDVCIDSLSEAFSVVAPAEVKAVLRPGGLEKVRPGLQKKIISALENQAVLKGIPLKADDKRQFLQYLVSMSLDYALKDAELLLAEPAVKLRALDAQKRQIQKYMTLRDVAWYRIRYYPVQTTLLSIASIYIIYSLYQQTKHTLLVSKISAIFAAIITHIQLVTKKAAKLLGFGTKKSFKRKIVRRVARR